MTDTTGGDASTTDDVATQTTDDVATSTETDPGSVDPQSGAEEEDADIPPPVEKVEVAKYFTEFLEYLDIDEEHFWRVCDHYRRPEIWKREGGEWKLRHQVS